MLWARLVLWVPSGKQSSLPENMCQDNVVRNVRSYSFQSPERIRNTRLSQFSLWTSPNTWSGLNRWCRPQHLKKSISATFSATFSTWAELLSCLVRWAWAIPPLSHSTVWVWLITKRPLTARELVIGTCIDWRKATVSCQMVLPRLIWPWALKE